MTALALRLFISAIIFSIISGTDSLGDIMEFSGIISSQLYLPYLVALIFSQYSQDPA